MTAIAITHNGKIANIDAVSAVLRAMIDKAWEQPKCCEITITRFIDGRDIKVKVHDLTSERMYRDGCSSIFEVEFLRLV